jgi:hypothetical protein
MVWRSFDNIIHFASDSRVTVGSHRIDAGIKVLRIPYRIVGVGENGNHPEIARGDIAMAASGASTIAMMTKEAIVEVLRTVQGIPGQNKFDMDEIANLLMGGFEQVCRGFAEPLGTLSDITIVFAGYCADQKKLRAFKIEHDGATNVQTINEVLKGIGGIEIYGSGAAAGRAAFGDKLLSSKGALDALQEVIEDQNEQSVGGNIQYGSFISSTFVIKGVAVQMDGQIHYWRGPIDLNGDAFVPGRGLLPLFPYLDMISQE